jgi:hypothetical protein
MRAAGSLDLAELYQLKNTLRMWRKLDFRVIMYQYKARGGMGCKHLEDITGIVCHLI